MHHLLCRHQGALQNLTHTARLQGVQPVTEVRVQTADVGCGVLNGRGHPRFGERLLHGNLCGGLELTPVSVKPGVSVKFTPLPFIVFEGGAQAGTGWNLAGLQGMAIFDPIHQTYTDLDAFQNWFLKWYAQGVFQFDTGAIISGDWTHIQLMYTYQFYYEQVVILQQPVEELGLIVSIIILILIFIVLWRIFLIGKRCNNV